MARLNEELQEQTANAESSGFEPLPDGAYHVRLADVDTTREGAKGPYWSWEFDVVEPDSEYEGRKLWNNTSLSEKAAFKMKETYEAFDVPLDTDTDDMLGSIVVAVVSQRTIQEGARKGEIANQIDRLRKPNPEVVEKIGAAKEAEKKEEDIF